MRLLAVIWWLCTLMLIASAAYGFTWSVITAAAGRGTVIHIIAIPLFLFTLVVNARDAWRGMEVNRGR